MLKDILFLVNKGEVIFIIGFFGLGKLIFLCFINFLEELSGGEILYYGYNVFEKGYDLNNYCEKFGMVF